MRKIFAPTMDPTSSWFLPRSTARSWLNEEDAMSWWDAWWEQKSYAFWDHCINIFHRIWRLLHACKYINVRGRNFVESIIYHSLAYHSLMIHCKNKFRVL